MKILFLNIYKKIIFSITIKSSNINKRIHENIVYFILLIHTSFILNSFSKDEEDKSVASQTMTDSGGNTVEIDGTHTLRCAVGGGNPTKGSGVLSGLLLLIMQHLLQVTINVQRQRSPSQKIQLCFEECYHTIR